MAANTVARARIDERTKKQAAAALKKVSSARARRRGKGIAVRASQPQRRNRDGHESRTPWRSYQSGLSGEMERSSRLPHRRGSHSELWL